MATRHDAYFISAVVFLFGMNALFFQSITPKTVFTAATITAGMIALSYLGPLGSIIWIVLAKGLYSCFGITNVGGIIWLGAVLIWIMSEINEDSIKFHLKMDKWRKNKNE